MDKSILDSRLAIGIFIAFIITLSMYLQYCDFDSTMTVDAQDETALHLAQCIRAECGECKMFSQERAAIAHVLRKRAKQFTSFRGINRTLDEQIVFYCAVFDKWSPNYYSIRSVSIRNSTFSEPLDGTIGWWEEMKYWTESFVRNPNDTIDPTPMAIHWGGKMDDDRALRAKWKLVASYSNNFWAYSK